MGTEGRVGDTDKNRAAYKVLVVDDEPDICWAIENALGLHGYTVTSVSSAEEGLELATVACYDLAFLDAKLPSMDGVEVARHIHNLCPQASVVLMSAYYYSQDKTVSEHLDEGILADFLPKPFELKKILELADRLLWGDEDEDSSTSANSSG